MRLLALFVCLFSSISTAATVVVVTDPQGAKLTIDSAVTKTTPCRVYLNAGSHTIVLKKEGYTTITQQVIVGTQLQVLRIALVEALYPVDILFKSFSKDTEAWSCFTPKGKFLGMIPGTFKFSRGKQDIVLIKDGFKDIHLHLTIPVPGIVEVDDPKTGVSSWAKVKHMRFVGEWLKPDTGSRLYLEANMTFKMKTHDHKDWSGIWKPTKDGIEITTRDKQPLILKFNKGWLTGRAANGWFWKLRQEQHGAVWTRQPYLAVIGCGRSGTLYISRLLRKWGLDVPHEHVGADGVVNWRGGDPVRLDAYCALVDAQQRVILHQVRHPLNTIASCTTFNEDSWRTIKKTLGDLPENTIQRCMLYWLAWNLQCEQQATYTYQIELLDKQLAQFQKVCELPTTLTMPKLSKQIHHRGHLKLVWNDLYQTDASLFLAIRSLAIRYGYAVDS